MIDEKHCVLMLNKQIYMQQYMCVQKCIYRNILYTKVRWILMKQKICGKHDFVRKRDTRKKRTNISSY